MQILLFLISGAITHDRVCIRLVSKETRKRLPKSHGLCRRPDSKGHDTVSPREACLYRAVAADIHPVRCFMVNHNCLNFFPTAIVRDSLVRPYVFMRSACANEHKISTLAYPREKSRTLLEIESKRVIFHQSTEISLLVC